MEVDATAASGQPSADNAGQAKTLDDAINAAFAASERSQEEPAKVEAKTPAASKPAKEADPGKAEANAGDEPDGENVAAKGQDEQAKVEGEPDKPAVEAPKHWPEKRRQTFAKMPPEVQQAWLEHDKDIVGGFTRKSQELSDKSKFADTVRGLFDDGLRQQMAQAGTDEAGAIRYLLNLQRHATTDPVGYAKWFMQQTGLSAADLGLLQNGIAKDGEAVQYPELRDLLSDPEVKQLKTELEQLKGLVTERERREHMAQMGRHAQTVQSIESTISSFRSALDDHGQLLYPHFDAVSKQMGALMDHDPELSRMPEGPDKLKAAYDRAVWAMPDVRSGLLEVETSKRVNEARRKDEAERAKRVTSVKPATGAPTAKTTPKSLDDIISEQLGRHMS